MTGKNRLLRTTFSLCAAALLLPLTINASIPPDRDEQLAEVVVTGAMRVGQGGAQDINFFRGEVAFERIPHPNDFTAEGLMSEHDIVLPAAQACRQLFCLTGDAVKADLLAVPQARYLVGAGFATNIDAKNWHRDPVNLVAVVDKSGSMDGKPLELVRQSLVEVAGQLHDGDQMTIVLYGDRAHVHLDTTRADRGGVARIIDSIGAIRSNGSTSMEAGLRLGYSVADATAPAFKGRTRLVLFTDERPNVDATDAASFMGMARRLRGPASVSPPSVSACSSARSWRRRSAACAAEICTSSATPPTCSRCSRTSSTTWSASWPTICRSASRRDPDSRSAVSTACRVNCSAGRIKARCASPSPPCFSTTMGAASSSR